MQEETKERSRPIFGFPDEWLDFESRNALFLERFPRLEQALIVAFIRRSTFSEPIDQFVFMYGRTCLEDFFESLFCCGNGYGHAAQKLLRGLYERAVTLRYLHEHPSELDDFLDFHWINQRKLMKACASTMGADMFTSEMTADSETRYNEVKDKFMVTDCEVCGTKRLNQAAGNRRAQCTRMRPKCEILAEGAEAIVSVWREGSPPGRSK